MHRVCILTDRSAQFTQPDFPGHERVFTIPFGESPAAGAEESPRSAGDGGSRLLPASVEDFNRVFLRLGRDFDSILVLTLSGSIHSTVEQARRASGHSPCPAQIEVLDSQTTGAGLGLLVQHVAEAVCNGASLREAGQLVRCLVPRLFGFFYIPELLPLAQAGNLSYSQARVAEHLGLRPIYTLEEGCLIPTGKARSPRQLFEAMQEFLAEFDSPEHIAYLHGASQPAMPGSRAMRHFVQEAFPACDYSEHVQNQALVELFGPHSLALVVLE